MPSTFLMTAAVKSDGLEKLRLIGLEEGSVRADGLLGAKNAEELVEEAASLILRGGERHDDVEIFRHDIRHLRQILDESFVLGDLEAQELVLLLFLLIHEEVQVRLDVETARTDDDLDGKVERVQELLVLMDDGVLFFRRLKIEIER